MYLEKCSEKQLLEIYGEFNITEESLKRDVNYLMEWMEKQPHLPNVKDRDVLGSFLIQCKNSLERTKKHIDSYYCYKALFPNVFANRNPAEEAFKNAFNVGCCVPLPKLTSDGHRVFIYRYFDPENSQWLTPEAEVKVTTTNFDINTKDDVHKSNIFIYDFRNASLSLSTTMFTVGTKYISLYQNLYSFRCHQVHIIMNLNSTIASFVNIAKGMMKKKLVDRFVMWTDEKPDLTSVIPAEILPKDYGGTEKPLKQLHEMFYQYICGFQEWLKSDEDMKADLSKRNDNLYRGSMDDSVDGSFRQLIID